MIYYNNNVTFGKCLRTIIHESIHIFWWRYIENILRRREIR
jgi:hypothetical protein